jgi:hypothetical protein
MRRKSSRRSPELPWPRARLQLGDSLPSSMRSMRNCSCQLGSSRTTSASIRSASRRVLKNSITCSISELTTPQTIMRLRLREGHPRVYWPKVAWPLLQRMRTSPARSKPRRSSSSARARQIHPDVFRPYPALGPGAEITVDMRVARMRNDIERRSQLDQDDVIG